MSELRNINYPRSDIINITEAAPEIPLQEDDNLQFSLLHPGCNSIAFDLDNTLIYSTQLPTNNSTLFIIQEQPRPLSSARTRSSLSLTSTIPSSSKNESNSSEPSASFDDTSQFKRAKPRSDTTKTKVKGQKIYIQFRPGLVPFFRSVSKAFNIFFFTSAERSYAKNVISKIIEFAFSPDKDIDNLKNEDDDFAYYYNYFSSNIENILFSREHCAFRNGYEMKDLQIIKQPLSNIILVDDMKGCGLPQPLNSVTVPAFYGNINDSFLLGQLLPLLMKCQGTNDFILNIRKYAETLSPAIIFYYKDSKP